LHDLCENYLPEDPVRPAGVKDEQWEKLTKTYASIAKWWKEKTPEVLIKEQPMVSEVHQFGGTLDGLALIDGEPWLYDFKTGSQVGPKEVCQMSAYRELLKETANVCPVGAILIHAPSKEPGFMRPVTLTADDLDTGWAIFQAALSVYRALPVLKAVCAE
jgi:hypothetical protein